MTKTLLLTDGSTSIVDDDVFEWASLLRWHPGGWHGRYVNRIVTAGSRAERTVYLHREILGTAKGRYTDHINGDPHVERRGLGGWNPAWVKARSYRLWDPS